MSDVIKVISTVGAGGCFVEQIKIGWNHIAQLINWTIFSPYTAFPLHWPGLFLSQIFFSVWETSNWPSGGHFQTYVSTTLGNRILLLCCWSFQSPVQSWTRKYPIFFLTIATSTTFITPSPEMHRDCLSLPCSGMRVLPLHALHWTSYFCMRWEINCGHAEGKNKLKLLASHFLLCIFIATLDPIGR